MPRPKIDDLAVASVIEVYEEGSRNLTAEQVTKMSQRKLGSWTPSLRKVQEILKEHRENIKFIEETLELSPLGEGWPTAPEEVHYLWEIGRRWRTSVQPRWTQVFIDTAFELKEVFDSSEKPHKWELPSPYGENAMVAGELAIIGEISNRRIISDGLNLKLPLEDLYEMLLEKPWASEWPPDTYSRVIVEGVHGIATNDIYHESREVRWKIWAAFHARDSWELEFYHGAAIDPDEDKTLTEKREMGVLKVVNELETEASTASLRFFLYLDELPEVRYVLRYKASLLSIWVYFHWGLQGFPDDDLPVSRQEIIASFDHRSRSDPQRWDYRESLPPFLKQ